MVTLRRERMRGSSTIAWSASPYPAFATSRDLAAVVRRSMATSRWVSKADHLPEINYDKIDKIKGSSTSRSHTAEPTRKGRAPLLHSGMPFRS